MTASASYKSPRLTLLRLIAPLTVSRVAVMESLLLPVLVLAVGIWISPLDPLAVRAQFPWTWLAPLILALRYGPFAGLTGAAILLAAWFGLQPLGFIRGDFPKVYFLGGLIAVMLCGEFSSIWRTRVRRAEAMQVYLDQRLEHLTHQHYLLRLSHDRLEQDLITRPMAMRDALTALRKLTAQAGYADVLPGANMLLRLLAQFCQLESAALYALRGAGQPPARAAQLGAPFELDAGDSLVRYALAQDQFSHIQSEGSERRSRYLVAAPITGGDGVQRALLVVDRMPFFALTDDTLQTLNLMLGYYRDGLDARLTAQPVLAAVPDCPMEFAFELMRVWRIRVESGVRSALVALVFGQKESFEDLPFAVRRQQRSLDVTWLIEADPAQILVTLMPLASLSGAEGYLARIEGWMSKLHGVDLAGAGVSQHVLLVDEVEPVALLEQLFRVCRVPRSD